MSKRYELATIQFQANARQANAAFESLRIESIKANDAVEQLKRDMNDGLTMGKYKGEELPISVALRKAKKDADTFKAALRDLAKGATVFEDVVKNMRTGNLEMNNYRELRAANKAALNRQQGLRPEGRARVPHTQPRHKMISNQYT